MTTIRPLAEPMSRRPGALGVHSIDHFHLVVPDAVAAGQFYCAFGLAIRNENGKLNLYTEGQPHLWGSLTQGPRKSLNYISFGAFEDDFSLFRERLEYMRIELLDPPRGFESNGLWFHDCDGTLLEIRVAEKRSPNTKPAAGNPPGKPGIANAPNRSTAPFVRPRRLAHILVFARNIPNTIKFYSEVLGLRLSDRTGDMIGFMHGIHGSDHHMIAFLKSEAPGLHHLSWDVGSIQAIGLGAMQMAAKGAQERAGGLAATCWDRITFTISAIRGAATANMHPTSTTSRRS